MTPPNTLQTHINNVHFHGGVRHPPFFVPNNNVGFNVWTPSNPGFNHAWHINRLHNGGPWSFHGYPGWPANRPPTLLAAMMSNPNKYNLLPFNRAILQQGRAPIQQTYNQMNGVGFSGQRGYQALPLHLPIWQYYLRQSPHIRYLALSNPPSVQEQLGLRGRTAPGQNPGPFPFATAPDSLDPGNALSGMPRTTLQRVTDAVGSLFGRRGMQGPPPIPGFPAGMPRSTPTVRSFPDIARMQESPSATPAESHERTEAAAALQELRGEIRTFVRDNQPLVPATERVIGMLAASIDASMQNPALNRNHVASSRMFWQSILAMDVRAREDRGMQPSTAVVEADPQERRTEVRQDQSAVIAQLVRFGQQRLDEHMREVSIPSGATRPRVFLDTQGRIILESDAEVFTAIARNRNPLRGNVRSNVQTFLNEGGRQTIREVLYDTNNAADRQRIETFGRAFSALQHSEN